MLGAVPWYVYLVMSKPKSRYWTNVLREKDRVWIPHSVDVSSGSSPHSWNARGRILSRHVINKLRENRLERDPLTLQQLASISLAPGTLDTTSRRDTQYFTLLDAWPPQYQVSSPMD